ncbi:putative methyltransferase [Gloeomargarita lithophora Alchichica-D10]|uniref:Putative methyltransferase n=1 Tax=Gloeomargarita lithophora Alchichica-D10 TaxID=1188229 RepID=A0A1J0AAD9_9CYAN|nr:MGMT family protein [Gloeomargarita lithophora]APB32894.1 putative methyltransferase [Gloeomargarita lithophora Alchichica-D10]
MNTYTRIYSVVQHIPYGRVATYGQVARLANLSGQARLVGYALYRLQTCPPNLQPEIPWQRVINAKGEISYDAFRHGNDHRQRVLLETEGVVFDANGKISLPLYQWQPQRVD